MTLSMHLRIVGVLLMLLGLSHIFFSRYFKWNRELADVSLFTRQVFFVHTFFIALGVVLAGAGSFVCADVLLRPGLLSRTLLAGLTLFWLCRLLVQFFTYDASLWRGDCFRTAMHIAFSALWLYVTVTYGIALVKAWI